MSNKLHSQAEGTGVLTHVAGNLRRLRQQAGISQLALAQASGLSRRMIVGLEAGETNISLSNLDKLAAALGTSFVALVSDPEAQSQRLDELLWKGRRKESRGVLLGFVPATQEAQLWFWSLAAGERYQAEPDPPGWHEMIFVVSGSLTLELETETMTVPAGQYAIYSSAQTYAYRNDADTPVAFVRNVAA